MRKLAVYTTMWISGMILPHLSAQPCLNSNLQGAYSFEASGTFNGLPFAAAGETLYGGDGQAQGIIQASSGGTILPPAFWKAEYSLTPMTTPEGQSVCVLTKTITISSYQLTISFFGTAGDDFRELRFIATTPGATVSGTARKQ
jgi:hypothetical protein